MCSSYAAAATHCNTLKHTATRCNTLQHTATRCNTLPHAATRCNTLQHTAARCNTLPHAATRCNTLQHAATRCNTLQQGYIKQNLGHCKIMHGEVKPLFKRLQIQLFVLRMIEFVSHITRIHVVFVTYVRDFVRRGGGLGSSTIREVGVWGRDPFSRNLMSPTPRRKWYLTTGRRFH